jgi:hypothetical protein
VIVVVGSPVTRPTEAGLRAAGLAVGVARAAAAAGAEVQIVGKLGEDQEGELALLDLAAARIGHVALLRDPSRATPSIPLPPPGDDEAEASNAAADTDKPDEPDGTALADGLSLDAGDLQLALRYLPDHRVLVIAAPLAEPVLRVALEAASWNGATAIVIIAAGAAQPPSSDDATVIEAPPADPDDSFAAIIGAYAAAIDRGEEPAEAFATASSGMGASAVSE